MAQELNVEYSTIVSVIPKVPSFYVGQGDGGYELYSIAEQYTIVCSVLGSDTASIGDFEANYKNSCQQVSSKDDAFLLGMLANKVPLVLERNADGVPLSTSEPRVGSELIMVTPNFCDKTTWYTASQRVTAETLTDSGDGLTFTSAHQSWINLYAGTVFDEDVTNQEGPYTVSVESDATPMAMVDPLYPEGGGDYTVNFAAGTLTFAASQTGKTVTATYSYATTSDWVLSPDPGKAIDIEVVEAQFSSNIVFKDTIKFEIWGYNPADLPNKIMYGETSYKSMRNFVDEALGSYPVIPVIGGDEGRGLTAAIYGFPFRYGTIRRLTSASGLELRIRLAHDIQFTGEHATATFYCTVRDL